MKVLVLGAPNSGKTRFANKIAKEKNLKVFDGPDKKFVKKTDLALGEINDYRTDFMFISEILMLENKHKDENYVITAGPFYSYCHFACKAALIQDDQKKFDILWLMMTMSRIALDSLWYDEIYYLPYKKDDETFSSYIDSSIRNSIRELYLEKKVITIE